MSSTRRIAFHLLATVCACSSPPEEVPEPMKGFERLTPGEWRTTLASGETFSTTWQWGPGRYSISQPGLELLYWHPGHQEVRTLSMHPDIPGVGRGVGEGTMRFEGDTAEGRLDLHQPRGLRRLGIRWEFQGPDTYLDTLLEQTGPEGLQRELQGYEADRVAAWTARLEVEPEGTLRLRAWTGEGSERALETDVQQTWTR